jgi:hypothetical protein
VANRSVVSTRSHGIYRGHRRCVCNVQRCGLIGTTSSGGNLEQYLVHVVRIRRDQLHEELEVRMLRGVGIVDRRVLLDDLAAAKAIEISENSRSDEGQVILLTVSECKHLFQNMSYRF